MHQGIGLDSFNALPRRRAIHALYECCCSVTWASRVAGGRPFTSHAELLARADAELFGLPDDEIVQALHCHPRIGQRSNSQSSRLEQCAVWAADPDIMHTLADAGAAYEDRFGFRYICCAAGRDGHDLLADLNQRMLHNLDTERKVLTDELAKITRTRLERMLGPEGGYPEY